MTWGRRELALALVRWQHGARQYWPYVCAAPFVSGLATPRSPASTPPAAPLLSALDGLPSAGRPALFVDLPPTKTLPLAAAIAGRGFLVVPVVQRWVAPNAVLPCELLVRQLMAKQPLVVKSGGERGVVLLLDGDRAGPPASAIAVSPRSFDNRYRYPICRFPPPRFLQQDRVTNVHWFSPGGIAADLRAYVQSLSAAGLLLDELQGSSELQA